MSKCPLEIPKITVIFDRFGLLCKISGSTHVCSMLLYLRGRANEDNNGVKFRDLLKMFFEAVL